MDSARKYTSVSQDSKFIHSTLVFPFAKKLSNVNADGEEVSKSEDNDDKSSLSNPKQSFNDIFDRMKAYSTSGAYESKLELDALNKIKVQCIQYLMRIIFGRDFDKNDIMAISNTPPAEETQNFGFIESTTVTSSFYAEQEETTFSTNGLVKTADGREIAFNLDLSMSRSFASYYEHSVSTLQAFTDPLVINLDSSIAEVSDIKVKFDLDCDGEAESISQLSSNSGFIALDKNGDGIINDGSELFGAKSGDGFADLAQFDSDGNGWIDEADDIFDKLKICVMNEDGSQTLYSLKDKDVGAICLSNASTDFALNNSITNETNARIRRTGIFLYESGGIGTVQHLDMAQ